MRLGSPYGFVAFTDERKRHILAFHPEVASCFRYFPQTLLHPDIIAHSIHDLSVVICYRYIPQKKKYLAIVIKTRPKPFILTAYLAKKPKRDTL